MRYHDEQSMLMNSSLAYYVEELWIDSFSLLELARLTKKNYYHI